MFRPALIGLFFLAIAVALLAIPRMPAAVAASPTPVPMTRPDFSSMKFLLGTWTCHQIVRGKNRPDTGTTTIGLDGAYMVTHDVAPAFDKYRTQAVRSDTYTTYNPQTHQWVSMSMDSFGGYVVTTSPGWTGNTMTSKTVMTNDGGSGTDTLTKVSDTQTRDAFTGKDAKGKVTRGTVTCTKS